MRASSSIGCLIWLAVLAPVALGQDAPTAEDSRPAPVVEAPESPTATAETEQELPSKLPQPPPATADEAQGAAPPLTDPASDETAAGAPSTTGVEPHDDAAPEAGDEELLPPEEGQDLADQEPQTIGQQWLQHVKELETAILERRAETEEADELYPQLVAALDAASESLAVAMDEKSESAHSAYEEMVLLYVARLRLLDLLSPLTRAEIKGFDKTGIEEFRDELTHIERHTRYQFETIRRRGRETLNDYLASPLLGLRQLLGLLLLIVFFRWWRRSGSRGIQSWRQKLMALRPRRRRNIRLAKFLWYVDRVRAPIEWLLLLNGLAALLTTGEAQFVELLWIVAKWILLGWFVVLLIDAMATRGAAGISRDQSGLRLRSLRWVSGWVVLRGMILELVASYGGEGTIYSWVATLALVALLPILAMLVLWWKDEIFARLAERKDLPGFVDRLQRRQTGLTGFVSASIAGVFLLAQGILRRGLRLLAAFEVGRRALAYFFRREVARQSERQRELATGKPIPLDMAQRLLARDGKTQEKVGRTELQTLITLSRSVERSTGAIVGERGCGKTRLLERLEESLGDGVLLVDCPPGNFEGLIEEIGKALGLAPEAAADRAAVQSALSASEIEVVAVDNFHRLTVPAIGGLDEIDRLLQFEGELGPELSWIISLDAAAWQYIRQLRRDLLLAHQIVEVKPWNEQDIGELIEARTRAAGIEPDFDQLILPAHLNETDFDGEESIQTGFYRIIWDSAKGNPEVAIRLWIESLAVLDDGRLAVRLFPTATYEELERLDPMMLFGLRAILRLEMATQEELCRSLRIPEVQAREILHSALNMGLIEEAGGRYSVPWRWYRPLSTVLMRQNLMKI